jgi:proteasome lid subunit RPN8/RPN11
MGMLMGTLGQKRGNLYDLVVVDAIPITHGGHIEVAFKDEDYVSFTEVDSEYQKKGIFNIGWYHSHPGLTAFLSSTDVLNHIGFQTTNPSAIAIVWDHQLLEEDNHAGFECFRLTELSKLAHSDYRDVKYEVQPPDDYIYYKSAIVDVITNMKSGKPPMLEENEIPGVVGNYNTKIPEESDFSSPCIEPIQGENLKISDNGELGKVFGTNLANVLNSLASTVARNLKNQNIVLSKNLESLSNITNEKVHDLQVWFINEFNEMLSDMVVEFDDKIEATTNQVKNDSEIIKKLQSMNAEGFDVSLKESDTLESLVQNLTQKMVDLETAVKQKTGGN